MTADCGVPSGDAAPWRAMLSHDTGQVLTAREAGESSNTLN